MNKEKIDLTSIEGIKKQIDILSNQYEELDREYIEYKEADMNREAGRIANKKYKISLELDNLKSKLKLKELVEKEKKDKIFSLQRRIDIFERFLVDKGLIDEFDRYELDIKEEEEEL
ncbi:MAG: hypothetical protein HFJ53_03115 [Clostridia bacterium]|jgi:hypothetical protein|nr:hypothetical protein [Clostridia bacterium]